MTTEELPSTNVERRLASSLRGVLVLAAWLLTAAAVAGPLSFMLSRFDGLTAAAFAWATCFVAGIVAQWLGGLFPRPQEALFRVLFGMGLRMGVPLAVCMVVQLNGGVLAEAGFVFYVMAFYFVTLAVELVSTAVSSPSSGARQAKAA